jgi:hypothetical protein
MDEETRAFGEQLGKAALARDWAGVHAMLAPWLRSSLSVDNVRAFFEDEYRSALAESKVDALEYPGYPEPSVDGNTYMNATKLREPISFAGGKVRNVAPELTDANMKFWMKLQLQCSDEQMERLSFDFFAEVWLAVAETDEGLRVGYWSQGAY